MIHVLQFLNGYAIVLIWGFVAFLSAVFLIRRRSRMRWWAVWTTAIAVTFSGLFFLRTADSTVVAAVPTNADDGSGMILIRDSLEWDSAESIEKAVLASDAKPTLVEFYTDFGFS
jgi:hypothetical protein